VRKARLNKSAWKAQGRIRVPDAPQKRKAPRTLDESGAASSRFSLCRENSFVKLRRLVNNSSVMITRIALAVLMASVSLPLGLANDKGQTKSRPAAPIAWLDLHNGARDLPVYAGGVQKVLRHISRGALLPIYRTKEKHGIESAQVAALNFQTGSSEVGWLEVNAADLKPADAYPSDGELLQLLGPPYLDDFVAAHTDIARFLVGQAQGPPALLCYVVARPLVMAKLVVFAHDQGKLSAGAGLDFPLSEMQSGITDLEIRDLLGNGSACVITKEPFREQAQTYGSILRIRTIANGQFKLVWQVAIEFQNLSQYGPKMQILQPPEQNIGAPGTTTTGEVTFRPSANGQVPVWKGKVEFFVFGRDKAVDSVTIEKACPWDGKEFTPLVKKNRD
jgi:hypothetical protein